MSCIISPEEGKHCGELLGVQQLVADALVHGGLAARHPALHQAGRHHQDNQYLGRYDYLKILELGTTYFQISTFSEELTA